MADDKYLQNRQLAYDLLKQEGYTDIGDNAEDLFKERSNAELAYKLLSEAGYTDVGKDYNEFSRLLYGPTEEEVDQDRDFFNQALASRGKAVSTMQDAPEAIHQQLANTPDAKPTTPAAPAKPMEAQTQTPSAPRVSRYEDSPMYQEQEEAERKAAEEAERYAAGRKNDTNLYTEATDEDILRMAREGHGYSIENAVMTGKAFESLAAEIAKRESEGKPVDRELAERADALLSTPVGREYNLLSGRVEALTKAEPTPENVWEMTQTQAELMRNPIARATMGDAAPSSSQIDFLLNRGEAEYINAKLKEGATKAEKKAYKDRLKTLNRVILDNEFYQADVASRIGDTDARIEEATRELKDVVAKADRERPDHVSLDQALVAYPEYRQLNREINQLQQTKRKLEHIRDKNAGDFWVNFMDVFADPNTYTFGITNLDTAVATLGAMKNPDAPGAKELLEAVAGKNATDAEEGQYVTSKGRWGAIAANSIPFMIQIGMTGGFEGVAKAVSGGVSKVVARKAGEEAAKRAIVKATGAVLGDLAAGFVSANTVGAPKTMNDFLNSYYGQVVKDENGNFVYEGGTGNAWKSGWGVEVGNTMEYFSERTGDNLQKLLGRAVLTKGKGWFTSSLAKEAIESGKVGTVSQAREAFAKTLGVTLKDLGFRSGNDISANVAMKALSAFIDVSNRVGIQGYPFEAVEEYVGLLGNIILGGEEKWMDFSAFGDKDTHADIWGGMLYSIGLTQSFAATAGVAGTAIAGIQKARMFHQLESSLQQMSDAAQNVLGEDDWGIIKNTIDGSTNQELVKYIAGLKDAAGLDDRQKAAVLDYAKNTFIYRGFNAGTIMQARERITNADNLKSINSDAEIASAADQIADAYMLGYTSSTAKRDEVEGNTELSRASRRSAMEAVEDREELEAAVARQKERFATMTGQPDITASQAADIVDDESSSQELKDAALDYIMAVAVENGFSDSQANKEMRVKAALERQIEENIGGRFYYENEFTGERFVESGITIGRDGKPTVVYILSDVPDGKGLVPYRTATGEAGLISRDKIYAMEEGRVVPGMTVKQNINEFMDEQYKLYEQNREAMIDQENAEDDAAAMVNEMSSMVGSVVALNDGSGETVNIERITNGGNVVISGDKNYLKALAEGLGMQPPVGKHLEIPATQLYPLITRMEDGSVEVLNEPGNAPAESGNVQNADDLIGTEQTIVVNGKPLDVQVTEVGDGKVVYEYTDENGAPKSASMPIQDFQQAMQGTETPESGNTPQITSYGIADNQPVAESAPQVAQQTPQVTPQQSILPMKDGSADWDNMFNVPAEQFAQRVPELVPLMQSTYGEDAVRYAQSWLDKANKELENASKMTGNPATDAKNAAKRKELQAVLPNYASLVSALSPAKEEVKQPEAPVEAIPAPASKKQSKKNAKQPEGPTSAAVSRKVNLAKARQKQRERGRFASQLDALGDYIDFEDYVMRTLLRENTKFKLSNSNDEVHKGLGGTLGLNGGSKDMRTLAWLLNNEVGDYPATVAERLLMDYAGEMGIEDIDAITGGDAMYELNILNEVLYRYPSAAAMMKVVEERHKAAEYDPYTDEELAMDMMAWQAREEGMDLANYLQWNEWLYAAAEDYYENYDEITAIFAEEEQERNEKDRIRQAPGVHESVHGGKEQGGDDARVRESDEVLLPQQRDARGNASGRSDRGNAEAEAESPGERDGGIHSPSVPGVPGSAAGSRVAEDIPDGFGAKNTVFTREDFDAALRQFREATDGTLTAGINFNALGPAMRMAGFIVEGGIRKFVDFANAMLKYVGESFRPYLKSAYKAVRSFPGMEEIAKDMNTDAEVDAIDINAIGKENNAPRQEENTEFSLSSQQKFSDTVAERLAEAMISGEKPYRSISDLRAEARRAGMEVDDSGRDDILLQELVEVALVKTARELMSDRQYMGPDGANAFEAINRLYGLQPTLGRRSSEKIAMQQYSTPLPMSFVAQMFAYKGSMQDVLEPTAGNGMLVFGVPASKVHANELDNTRKANLDRQGYKQVTQQDATQPFEGEYDAVIANPPFGSHPAVVFDGKEISGLDPVITLRALDAMKDDGRAAIIIGGNVEWADNGSWKTKKAFFSYLYDHYNVKGVVNMSGDMYAKQGTTFPTMMILIDGRRSEDERAQSRVYPPVKENARKMATTPEELYDIVNEILNENSKTDGSYKVVRTEGERKSADGIESSGNLFDGNSGSQSIEDGTDGRGNAGRGNVGRGSVQSNGRNAVRGTDVPNAQVGTQANGMVGRKGDKGDVRAERTPQPERGENGAGSGSVQGNVRGDVSGSEADTGNGQRISAGKAGRESAESVSGGESTLRKPVRVAEKRKVGDKNLAYVQHSSGTSLESVAPAAMVESMDAALQKIEKEVGKSIDEFVMDELGYKSGAELYDALAAEQIDSVAMAIYNMKKGGAMIIGDQTGVGKGRQMAALIRWANRQGKKPIFFTQKAGLFSDMYRDLSDIGSAGLKPLIINSKKGNKDNAGVMDDKDGKTVYTSPDDAELKRIVESGKIPEGYDYVVLTYSQLSSGDEISRKERKKELKINSNNQFAVAKARFIRSIASDNYVLLDESHTAAGADSNSGAFLQSIMPSVKGVTFASATFAKRPDTMPLYAIKSAISQANVEPSELIQMIEKGGVTLQEIMARALTGSGQMVRRERDMSDVQTDWKMIDDPAIATRARENYDKAIKIFNDIINFQNTFIAPVIREVSDNIAAMMATAETTRGTKNFGADNPPFVNQAYNFTKQLMLALKADAIVQDVVSEIKAGRHPVIALENTFGSLLEAYKAGDKVEDTSFSAGLLRSLDRILQYTVRDEDGQHQEYLTPEELGAAGAKAYYDLQDRIREATKDIFMSPLDAITMKLQAQGYKVGEITGRDLAVVKEGSDYMVRNRVKDKKQAVRDFNDGTLDVLIINKTGSTGISLHASAAFKDQRQRSMIIAQPLGDIADYMQMIGRIDRTGQVHRGYYINLSLPVPAELRFNMMLATKLKSLNANTTTSQESDAASVDAPDFLNKYGSQVVIEYLRDHPEVFEKLVATGLEFGGERKSVNTSRELESYQAAEEDAQKTTGRIALLPVVEQEAFYNDIADRYNALIKYLDETGENTLKITTLPLKAKTLARKVGTEGRDPGGSNPFAQNSYVERVEVDVLKKPMKAEEIRKVREGLLGGKSEEERTKEILDRVETQRKARVDAENERYERKKEKVQKDIDKQVAGIKERTPNPVVAQAEINRVTGRLTAELEEEHNRNLAAIESMHNRMRDMFEQFDMRTTNLIPETIMGGNLFEGASIPALFLGYKTAKPGDNITPSTSFAVFATLDGRRRIEIKFTDKAVLDEISNLTNINYWMTRETNIDNWDSRVSNATRETRYILTGNVLQAWSDASVGGILPGRLVSYTDADGNIKDGILMNSTWDAGQLRSAGAPINTAKAKIEGMPRGDEVESVDGLVSIVKSWNRYALRVPKSKKEGAKYFQDKELLSLVGGSFYQHRGRFEAEVSEANLGAALDRLAALGVRVEAEDNGNSWEELNETENTDNLRFRDGEEKSLDAMFNKGLSFIKADADEINRTGKIPFDGKGITIRLGTPGSKLLFAGLQDQPILVSEKNILDFTGVGPLYEHTYHKYDIDALKDLVSLINDPVAVFADVTKDGRIDKYQRLVLLDRKVTCTELSGKDANGNLLVVIKSVPVGDGTFENVVKTIFPVTRKGKYSQLIDWLKGAENERGEQYLKYAGDTKKITSWIEGSSTNVASIHTTIQEVVANVRKFHELQKNIRSNAREYREGLEGAESRINDAEMQAVGNMLDSMGREMGAHIRKVTRNEMPKGHESDKGYFDPNTGHIVVCMDNVTDERDAIATVLHESVGHFGLRKLFGKRFNEAMTNIYARLDSKGREWVHDYMARHDLKPGDADAIIIGMEEYLAYLAESGDFKKSVWDRIKEIFCKLVDMVFGTENFVFTDKELKYILRASYENLKNKNWLDTIEGKAKDTIMKYELGINESNPRYPTDSEGSVLGPLFRDGDSGAANADYDAEMKLRRNAMIMEHQNADLPVKIGMEKIMKETGKKSVAEEEDYLTRHNLASSRAETQAHEFELFHFKPMLEQVRVIQSKLLDGKRKTKEAREDAYERILDYLYAVSGLERNAYKNAEIEQAKQDALSKETDPAKRAAIEDKYESMKKDWAGITSLMGMKPSEWRDAETMAQTMADDFRTDVGDGAAIDELWNRIRSCTDFSLEHAFRHGLLTREEYERLHGTASQPRMWEYYLPLRGFSEETAEQEFNYANVVNPQSNSVVVKKMKGRWSKADNPLANILNIAETEIVQGNDNWAKQALWRFTLNAGENTLLTPRDAWYEKNPATGVWSLAHPGAKESFEAFESRMKAMRDNIQPNGQPGEPLAKVGRRGLSLDKIMANKANQNAHIIHLKVGGVEKMIWVNGNPAIAEAVTGANRANNMKLIRKASRALSNLFTTYSLDFTARNLFRDTMYSRLALIAKEDNAYRQQYRKNWWDNFGYGAFAFPMVRMMAQWESGKLQQKQNPTAKEQMFMDFMRDGGQTGYTIINSVSEIKKQLDRSMRHAGKNVSSVRIPIIGHYAKMVKTLNEAFELLTRFTAYQTSRDMGRSGQRSASDAKEISVNFNRKGAQSGNGFWGGLAAYLGATQYFYNAGVQGFDNFLRLFKVAPVKMTAATGGLVLLGMMMPILNAALAGLVAGLGDGDDDPDWYWNLPEWVRRNHIVIGTGKWYLAIPLAVELRAPYGLGDIAGSLLYHKAAARDAFSIGLDAINTAANIMPVNPIEGYTANGNIGDAILRAVTPDAGMFIVDIATNRDYTGRPLWKENPFSDTTPKSQSAYASTPKLLVEACQGLAKVTNGGVDIPPGAVRDIFKNLGGGIYDTSEDVAKMIYTDSERPFRYDNIPFLSGFTGHIDEDRSNSFASNALYEYRNLSEGVVKRLNAAAGTDEITASMAYDHPETLPEGARIQRILEGEDYILGKMYREGMNNEYVMKQYTRGDKMGQWYKSKEIKRKGVKTLESEWKSLREEYSTMPEGTDEEKAAKAEMLLKVQDAWHAYYDAQANLVDRLMEEEYNHVQRKRENGIHYDPKPSISERVYNAVKEKVK